MSLSKLFGKSLTLVIGTATSQILPIVSLPFLSVFFNPESFGLLSIFMSIGAVISIASTGRYEFAILHPTDEKEALSILFLASLSSLFISISIGLFSVFLYYVGGEFFFSVKLKPDFLLLLPLSILSYSMLQVLNYWYSRKDRLAIISILRVIQSILIVGFSILFGWLGLIEMGLIYAFAIGGAFVLIVLLFLILKNIVFFSLESLINQARKYQNYPRHLMTTALMDTFAVQAPIFFIASSFDTFLVGSYGFASRIVMAPITLISASIGQVYYQQIAGAGISGSQIANTFRKTFLILLILSIVFFSIGFFFGENLVAFFFKEEWYQSGFIVSILCLALLVRFIVSPLSLTLIAINQFKWVSIWQTLYLVSTVLFFMVVPEFGFEKMLYFFAIHESVHYVFYFLIIKNAVSAVNK